MLAAPVMASVGASAVADQLNRVGVACLPDVIAPRVVAAAQHELQALVEQNGHASFALLDLEQKPDLTIGRLAADASLRGLVEELVEFACPQDAWPARRDAVGTSLNVTVTSDQPSRSGNLHYDASIVTVVVPLQIPDCGCGQSGELVVFPNKRPFRHSVARNVVDKVRDQNGRTASRMLDRMRCGAEGDCLPLKVGNVYAFWGYRTLHGTLPCPAGCVRATLTIHGGDPHGHAPALRLLKSANDFRAARSGWRRVVDT